MKTTTSSYGNSASRINVSRKLIELETRRGCECEHRSEPCPACADKASDLHWAQLSDTERAELQAAQRADKADMSCFGW
jgi:hypothetical protein